MAEEEEAAQAPGLGKRGPQGGRQDMQKETKKDLVFGDFETMDTQPARQALSAKRLAWCENCIILAPNQVSSVPGQGSVLATLTGETISVWYFAFFNSIDYLVCFCQSGAAYTVNLATGAKVNFAVAGTFSPTPDMTQWKDERILIADATGGYCTYDGTNFIQSGNVSPNIVITSGGEGYTSAPTPVIAGGTGSGATASATVTNGIVTRVNLTNPGTGYVLGDVLTISFSGGSPTAGGVIAIDLLDGGIGYLSVPTITIAAPAGGGVTATATATRSLGAITAITITNAGSGYKETPAITITPTGGDTPSRAAVVAVTMDTTASALVRIWPVFGTKPKTLAIFQGRVWLAQIRTLTYTGTLGYDDMDAANAAGETILQDADLVHEIIALRSANNYLFIMGDQSIKQIGQISVTGTITNFNIVTLNSDQGTTFKDTIVSYNRLVMMTNRVGTYAIFGASVEKISDPMSAIFDNRVDTIAPVTTVLDLMDRHLLLTLVKYNDPVTGPRSLIMAYQNKRWSVLSQGDGLITIMAAPLEAGEKIYGTSGADVTQLFANTSVDVMVKLQSALSHNGNPYINKLITRVGSAQSSTSSNTVTVLLESEVNSNSYSFQIAQNIIWQNNALATITWRNNALQTIVWSVPGFLFYDTALSQASGIYLGFTLTGSFTQFSFNNFCMEYKEGALFKSKNI